ncbi:MAG: CPBP family glutamic-type intramembrane protease [Planctomycetota bacterium]
MKAVFLMVLAAMTAFFVLFGPWTKSTVSFWLMMPMTAGLLATTSLFLERKNLDDMYQFRPCHVVTGLFAAGCLYLVFWVGHFVSTCILPFAASQVDSIYGIRSEQNLWVISLLLLFVIGPAEEIFWRGFVQRRLSKKWGVLVGFIAATAIYTLVHIWSFNFMLIVAAALCGVFWGLLFVLTKNLWPCIISHAIWDMIIFILLPIK